VFSREVLFPCMSHTAEHVLTVAYNADRGTRKESAAVGRIRIVLQQMNRSINHCVIFIC